MNIVYFPGCEPPQPERIKKRPICSRGDLSFTARDKQGGKP